LILGGLVSSKQRNWLCLHRTVLSLPRSSKTYRLQSY